MLHGDAGRPALPALAEVGNHDIPKYSRQGQIGEQPVQYGLRGRLAEGVHGLPERGAGSLPAAAATRGPAGRAGAASAPPPSAARAASAADIPSAR
jgi:hypothetical protein